MVNAAAQYRRALEKQLRCGKEVKNRLIAEFDKTLGAYLKEYDNPSMDELIAAFGPPEEMAKIIMTEVTPLEQARYRRFVLFKQMLTLFFAILLTISTVYLWFCKEVGLNSSDNMGVVDEFTYPSTKSDIGGDLP